MSAFPSVSPVGERRQARLSDARLWIVGDARASGLEQLLTDACEGSADVIELRDDTASEDALRTAADVYARVREAFGALFFVASLPGLALQVAADGVQLTRLDVAAEAARLTVGPDLLVGATAHTPDDVDDTADHDLDVLMVRAPALGRAIASATGPWFGQTTRAAAAATIDAGARRIAVTLDEVASHATEICWELRRELARSPLH